MECLELSIGESSSWDSSGISGARLGLQCVDMLDPVPLIELVIVDKGLLPLARDVPLAAVPKGGRLRIGP